jgi:two-component system cell cycle sensor histidine kinase/response regulator CckA
MTDGQTAESRRTAALARFLGAAVDPAISRPELLQKLVDELAETIGDLAVIIEQAPDAVLRMAGVAGGPGDTAARVRRSHLGQPIAIPEPARASFLQGATMFLSPVPDEIRVLMVGSMRMLGLPDDVATSVNSIIAAGVRGQAGPIGRIHVLRFGDDEPYTAEDRATVEVIASAAALILERRAAEYELATSLARFEALFEQVPIPLVTVDPNRVTRHNQAALDLFGRDRDEMSRLSFQPDAPWIPEDQKGLWTDMRRRVAAGEAVTAMRIALIRPNGERREVEGASIRIVTRDGTPAGVVTVMTDLTERLSLEAQFRHAQKMEALGRLAGGVAHDFNNVLMAILGYAEFIAHDSREGVVSPDHADQVIAATRRAIELTGRLTAFARREVSHREPVEIAELVRAILPLVHRLAPESIEVETHLEPGPAVVLDRSEFEQVLLNLVVNAVDAMPDGGRLTIEAEPVDLDEDRAATHLGEEAGPRVLVAVSDTGIGMDDETRSRMFEPFYTTKPVGEGTGLGLAMVFASVERAGGRIWVYSEPGHGSTFKIYLPPAEPGASAAAAQPDPASAAAGGSESILLLEDDPLVRELVTQILRARGYDVIVTARPSEAIAAAERRRFDLLVSDVVMPEMMGDAVAARLRTIQPALPVVFMSGYTARALDFSLGANDTLVHKPVTPGELARAVRSALDGRPE